MSRVRRPGRKSPSCNRFLKVNSRGKLLVDAANYASMRAIAWRFGRSSRRRATQRVTGRRFLGNDGAGEGIRTLDPDLGKVVLYP